MSNATAAKNFELSLMELLWGFMELASDAGEPSFPPYESWMWHDFLFKLKEEFREQFPALDCIGAFDWNEISPKCREFDVVMFGLRYQSFSHTPGGRVVLDHYTRREYNSFLKHMPKLAQQTLNLARTIPGFFE